MSNKRLVLKTYQKIILALMPHRDDIKTVYFSAVLPFPKFNNERPRYYNRPRRSITVKKYSQD